MGVVFGFLWWITTSQWVYAAFSLPSVTYAALAIGVLYPPVEMYADFGTDSRSQGVPLRTEADIRDWLPNLVEDGLTSLSARGSSRRPLRPRPIPGHVGAGNFRPPGLPARRHRFTAHPRPAWLRAEYGLDRVWLSSRTRTTSPGHCTSQSASRLSPCASMPSCDDSERTATCRFESSRTEDGMVHPETLQQFDAEFGSTIRRRGQLDEENRDETYPRWSTRRSVTLWLRRPRNDRLCARTRRRGRSGPGRCASVRSPDRQ